LYGTITDQEDAEAVEQAITTVSELERISAESYESTVGFAESLASLPHIERSLARSAKHASAVVARTEDVIANARSEYTRTRGLLEERLRAYRDDGS
jgi:hypothetical protein